MSHTVHVTFRRLVKDIPSTTWSVFSLYKYPAKFIPQVVAYVLKTYAVKGMKVFDPFAGYGTVGLVSRLYGYDYVLWDLNPMLEVVHKTATIDSAISYKDLLSISKEIRNSSLYFLPDYRNLQYWIPEQFLELISRSWGYVHALDESVKYFFVLPLLKTTRFFSWSDEKIHKLYRSKYAVKKVETLLQKNWTELFYEMLDREIALLYSKLMEYRKAKPKNVNGKVFSGVDTLEMALEEDVDILITSPPYLQAQEYIRSTKLELIWLGYSENYIRELSKKEIPYRSTNRVEILSEEYYRIRNCIEEPHLQEIYDNYFNALISIFSKLSERVSRYMCIFVGPAKVRERAIPIDVILAEHMTNIGWEHIRTYIDRIAVRYMFKSTLNPATGLKDERIQTEHLIILRRR